MIDPERLNVGHALSLTNQPALGELYDLISTSSEKITFVVGAGTSIDAGILDWRGLVESIARRIKDASLPRLADFAIKDHDDLMRKAEYIIEMKLAADNKGEANQLVRDTLYGKNRKTVPGAVASALCSLIEQLNERAAIVTTNFDDVLDVGLAGATAAFTLDTVAQWQDAVANPAPRDVPILYLHGLLHRHHIQGPLILTESHFLEHGPRAREAVREALETTNVVFIGVSLTDPNLVGPLWDTRTQRKNCFVIHVPSALGLGETIEEARTYAIKKYGYLENKLRVNTIFLKSYLQLEQTLQELALSFADPATYNSTDPATSTRYGYRFARILDGCYRKAGCDLDTNFPSHADGIQLSDDLHAALDDTTEVGKLLDGWGSDTTHESALAGLRVKFGSVGEAERFGLFLWLRSRDRTREAPYAVNLVGASPYIHREPWSMGQDLPIEPRSDQTVARVLFRGSYVVENVPREADNHSIWHGVICVPIRIIQTIPTRIGPVQIPVTVGAIGLQTTHYVNPRLAGKKHAPVSLLAVLSKAERLDLAGKLELEARSIVGT